MSNSQFVKNVKGQDPHPLQQSAQPLSMPNVAVASNAHQSAGIVRKRILQKHENKNSAAMSNSMSETNSWSGHSFNMVTIDDWLEDEDDQIEQQQSMENSNKDKDVSRAIKQLRLNPQLETANPMETLDRRISVSSDQLDTLRRQRSIRSRIVERLNHDDEIEAELEAADRLRNGRHSESELINYKQQTNGQHRNERSSANRSLRKRQDKTSNMASSKQQPQQNGGHEQQPPRFGRKKAVELFLEDKGPYSRHLFGPPPPDFAKTRAERLKASSRTDFLLESEDSDDSEAEMLIPTSTRLTRRNRNFNFRSYKENSGNSSSTSALSSSNQNKKMQNMQQQNYQYQMQNLQQQHPHMTPRRSRSQDHSSFMSGSTSAYENGITSGSSSSFLDDHPHQNFGIHPELGSSSYIDTSTTSRSVTNSQISPNQGNPLRTRKGVLWQQRDKLFSRWKERYFILTEDYFHCFKKGSSRITDMGAFIFKLKLTEVDEVELLDKRGYLTVCISLFKDGKIYLRRPEGIKDWFLALQANVYECKRRRQYWTDTAQSGQNIEQWLLSRQNVKSKNPPPQNPTSPYKPDQQTPATPGPTTPFSRAKFSRKSLASTAAEIAINGVPGESYEINNNYEDDSSQNNSKNNWPSSLQLHHHQQQKHHNQERNPQATATTSNGRSTPGIHRVSLVKELLSSENFGGGGGQTSEEDEEENSSSCSSTSSVITSEERRIIKVESKDTIILRQHEDERLNAIDEESAPAGGTRRVVVNSTSASVHHQRSDDSGHDSGHNSFNTHSEDSQQNKSSGSESSKWTTATLARSKKVTESTAKNVTKKSILKSKPSANFDKNAVGLILVNNADDSASAEGVLSSDIVTQAEKKASNFFGYSLRRSFYKKEDNHLKNGTKITTTAGGTTVLSVGSNNITEF